MSWLDRQAKRAFLRAADTITHGTLEIVCPDRTYGFEGAGAAAPAMMVMHDERAFARAILEGDRGLGESFMDGDFSSPDLVALLRLAIRNGHAFNRLNGPWSWVSRQLSRLAHWRRSNTRPGSRRNIAAHYDLGNDFFALFLDPALVYSAAVFEAGADSLEQAQVRKIDRVCRKLQIAPGDHVLEIGTGWGAFAAHAASRYGCHVTTTTISREQHDYAQARFERLGEAGRRITLLLEDYRELRGRFDKIASIEMFEAVGLEHYDAFFGVCERLIGRAGAVLMQTITMNEQDFHSRYRRMGDWMQQRIFPGSELASLSEVLRSVGRVTSFRPFHLEDLGLQYARTLREWRTRFLARREDARRLGMDDRFLRMWELYLAFSEAAFAERHISDVQLLLTRGYHDATYFGETALGLPAAAFVAS
jgi:cyclopropane-fatty-acyl-phospholipid synthase